MARPPPTPAPDAKQVARWIVVHRGSLRVVANLGYAPVSVTVAPGRVLLASDPRAGSSSTVTISPRRTQDSRPSAVVTSHAAASSEASHDAQASS